jgi:prevent-host-death family protein
VYEELGVAELKRRFSELLNRVELKGERIAIRRRGRQVAALVPVELIQADGLDRVEPKRGLTAAAGIWEGFDDIEAFIASVKPGWRQRGDGSEI